MESRIQRLLLAGLAAMALAASPGAHADDDGDHDHDVARGLREGGEIRALSEILRDVRRQVSGDIVAIKLVREGSKWLYRVQIIAPDGSRDTVDIDARSSDASNGEGHGP